MDRTPSDPPDISTSRESGNEAPTDAGGPGPGDSWLLPDQKAIGDPDSEEDAVTRLAIDERRLLPGESPDSRSLQDADHWIDIYTQLRDTKQSLILSLDELMRGRAQEARDELERADVRILKLQVERFERRLAFWQDRRSAVAANSSA